MDAKETALWSRLLNVATRFRHRPEVGVILAFVVMSAIFSILSPSFLSLRNLTGMFTVVSELGIMTIGITFIMIAGEFDMSVSSVYALGGFLFVTLANGMNSLVAMAIVLLGAVVIGFINAIVVLKTRIPSFIATLGMMMFLRGVLLAITGGKSVKYVGDSIVPAILSTRLPLGFRPSHFWFLGLTIVFSVILMRTRYGNWVFATGGDKAVARAMGVNTDRVKIINFMVSSVLASLAGMMVITRFWIANASFGQHMELEAIAAAVIGGTFLTGGYGSIVGAFFGAFLMGTVRTGLVMSGAPAYWYRAFVGAILIIAAAINLKLRSKEM